MKNQIKNTLCMGIMAAAGAAAMFSCSDTWDDHYNSQIELKYDGTLMQALETEAPDFADVVKAVGFDRELASDNVYTIWAPKSFNKAELLAKAQTDSAFVVDRFIKNHMARYSVSQSGVKDEKVSLLSNKLTIMTKDNKFGTSTMTKTNLSCGNGILHVIDENIEYQKNVFEEIESLYNPETDDISLYAFLKIWNSDSLDENRSVSHGVDEDGEKIWVDSVMIRNNTVLKNIDALIYREDSNYTAIVPTAEAYKQRYQIAEKLLVFNPKENEGQGEGRTMDTTDSLKMYYANMFALSDLFYNMNKTSNEHKEDSLKSTQYVNMSPFWPNHVYYTKEPKNMHPDKQVNDIIAKSGTPVECSNGLVYTVDEYPMTPLEQFFYKIDVEANTRTMVSTEINDGKITRNIGSTTNESGVYYEYKTDEAGDTIEVIARTYHFMDVPTMNSTSNIEVGFKVPNTLSGTYDIYLVTCPIWAKNYGFREGMTVEDDPRPYKFSVSIFERGNEPGKSTYGNYPTSGTKMVVPDPDSKYFITDPTHEVDTLYLGDFTFKNAYYGRPDEGVVIKVESVVTSSEYRKLEYSREMLISGFIFRPKLDETAEAEEAKRK